MRALLLLLPFSACAPASLAPDVAPPALVPVQGLLAAGDALASAVPPGPDLAAGAAALAARAGGLGAARDGPDPERAAALASRAAALRAPVLTQAERARLAEAPSLQ